MKGLNLFEEIMAHSSISVTWNFTLFNLHNNMFYWSV